MTWNTRALLFALLMLSSAATAANAQATPAASRTIDFSAFGGLTGTYTGLSGGRNLSITAGFDVNLPPIYGVRPSVEVRGTTPIKNGHVDAQKDILVGPRAEFTFGRLHPYADFLIGRGKINYIGNYITYNSTIITGYSTSTVLSPGIGVRLDVTRHISALADVQFQRWSTPVSLSGHLLSKPLTVGLSYRFAWPGRHAGTPR